MSYTDRDIKRRQKVVNEYRKLQARCLFVILSGVVSFFLVPVLIDYIHWDITINMGDRLIELDGFILYILLLMLFYMLFRVLYYWKVRRIQKGKYRRSSGKPRTRK